MKIKGIIVSGCGVANRNIQAQKKHFNDLPHIDDLYDGTINLNISPRKFKILKSEHPYPNVNWGSSVENFEFIPIRRLGGERDLKDVAGYLYLPSGSPNRIGKKVLEIWTTKVDNVRRGNTLVLEIPDGYLEIFPPHQK